LGGHPLCETLYYENNTQVSTCAGLTLDSHEVLMDVKHPDIWIHTAK
jgi:hypothetical protein